MKKFWFIVGIILIFAAIPRAVELISHNYLFGFDQGNFMLAVKHIVVDHKLTLIGVEVGNIGGFFQGPDGIIFWQFHLCSHMVIRMAQ